MKYKARLERFIELQDKGLKFEDIALELGIAKTTLRVFLNKNGYKMYNGKYKVINDINKLKKNEIKNIKTSNKNKSTEIKECKNISKKTKPKKNIKVNINQDDLDKLCEVYDWYMQVKDLKAMKSSKRAKGKDIKIENTNIETLKKVSIKVEKDTWEDFERLCSNSNFSKQEIITQALKDFMKEYKNLL